MFQLAPIEAPDQIFYELNPNPFIDCLLDANKENKPPEVKFFKDKQELDGCESTLNKDGVRIKLDLNSTQEQIFHPQQLDQMKMYLSLFGFEVDSTDKLTKTRTKFILKNKKEEESTVSVVISNIDGTTSINIPNKFLNKDHSRELGQCFKAMAALCGEDIDIKIGASEKTPEENYQSQREILYSHLRETTESNLSSQFKPIVKLPREGTVANENLNGKVNDEKKKIIIPDLDITNTYKAQLFLKPDAPFSERNSLTFAESQQLQKLLRYSGTIFSFGLMSVIDFSQKPKGMENPNFSSELKPTTELEIDFSQKPKGMENPNFSSGLKPPENLKTVTLPESLSRKIKTINSTQFPPQGVSLNTIDSSQKSKGMETPSFSPDLKATAELETGTLPLSMSRKILNRSQLSSQETSTHNSLETTQTSPSIQSLDINRPQCYLAFESKNTLVKDLVELSQLPKTAVEKVSQGHGSSLQDAFSLGYNDLKIRCFYIATDTGIQVVIDNEGKAVIENDPNYTKELEKRLGKVQVVVDTQLFTRCVEVSQLGPLLIKNLQNLRMKLAKENHRDSALRFYGHWFRKLHTGNSEEIKANQIAAESYNYKGKTVMDYYKSLSEIISRDE